MLDCDTTGVEPDIALVKYKKLVGGGMLKMVNQTVPAALLNFMIVVLVGLSLTLGWLVRVGRICRRA